MNSSRRNARGEVTLRRILHATVELIGRYGYDNTTIARIVKATARPASSIYWYFETKDELIAAALEDSYSKVPRSHRPWDSTFDPDRPLLDQLLIELGPELLVTESERPLRLGIMLALEGSAATSKVQEPFRRRRAAALTRVQAWWAAVFASHPDTGVLDHTAGTLWMTTLTLAFLDGHYISDIVVDEQTAIRRSRILARALDGAFEFVLRSAQSLAREPDLATAPSADEASGWRRSTVAGDPRTHRRARVRGRHHQSDLRGRPDATQLGLLAVQGQGHPGESRRRRTVPGPAEPSAVADGLDRRLAGAVPGAGDDDVPDTGRAGHRQGRAPAQAPTLGTPHSGRISGVGRHQRRRGRVGSTGSGGFCPEEHGAQQVDQDLAWIVARFVDGFMLAPALGYPVRADSAAKILIPLLTSVSTREPQPPP